MLKQVTKQLALQGVRNFSVSQQVRMEASKSRLKISQYTATVYVTCGNCISQRGAYEEATI